jgi:hypothetical protein
VQLIPSIITPVDFWVGATRMIEVERGLRKRRPKVCFTLTVFGEFASLLCPAYNILETRPFSTRRRQQRFCTRTRVQETLSLRSRRSTSQASTRHFISPLEPWDGPRDPTRCTNAEMRFSPRRRSSQSSSARGSFGRPKPPARATAQVKLVPRQPSSSFAAALTVDLDNIPNPGPSR